MYIANIPHLAKMYSSGITTTYVFWVDIHVLYMYMYCTLKLKLQTFLLRLFPTHKLNETMVVMVLHVLHNYKCHGVAMVLPWCRHGYI